MSDLVGRTVGQYQIVEEIGRGGMAVVYKAWQPSLQRYVALKVLPPQFTFDQQFVARFQWEARAVAQFSHSHIVAIHDTGVVDGLHYIAMEYLEGGSLSERLAGRPVDLAEAERIAREVGSALDYAHRRGLVHRDVKPGNILFTEEGTAKVSDFGIVRAADGTRLTRTGVLLGTPEYMAPEQVEGEEVDWRADLYALGVVLYQMATGAVPFRGTTPHAIMHAAIYDSPAPPRQVNPGLSSAIETVLLKALAKDPEQRFQSGHEMAEAFSQACKGARVHMAPAPQQAHTAAATTPTRFRIQPWMLWGSIVAAIIVAASAGWLLLSDRDADSTVSTATAQALTQEAGVGPARAGTVMAGTETTIAEGDVPSATATAAAPQRAEVTFTAQAKQMQATLTAIAVATEMDLAVTQTAEAMGTRMASEATQTALARPTDTPLPAPTTTPSQTPTATPSSTPTHTPQAETEGVAVFQDSFSGSSLDSSKWNADIGAGEILMGNGVVRMRSSGSQYPYIYSRANPFPSQGDFRMTVRLRYPWVRDCGVGVIMTSCEVPPGVSQQEAASIQARCEQQGVTSGVWQDQANGLQLWFRSDADRQDIQFPGPDTKWNNLQIEYSGGRYTLYLNGKVAYASLETPYRPRRIWLGHPANLGVDCWWCTLEVDQITVKSLP